MKNTTSVLATIVAMMFLLAFVHGQDCNPMQDIPDCIPAIESKGLPSPRCCELLNQHKGCLCKYIDINNRFRLPQEDHQHFRIIVHTCGVFFPFCPNDL